MSSRCRNSALVVLALFALGGCEREHREFTTDASSGAHYENNAFHITQGGRLFHWMNCGGCHANGGGAIGPALMDAPWRYGGSIEAIHATILAGRPRGMPSFRDRLTDVEAWQIAAYVRALAGNVRKDAAPSRRDSLAATPPLTRVPAQPPKPETVPEPRPVQ
jgi:cytochrome c oxidase cbb3-type subunit 3